MSAVEVDVGGREVLQAFVITTMIIARDEGIDLLPEITRYLVVFQQDGIRHGLAESPMVAPLI